MYRLSWRGLLEARADTDELYARLAEPRPFFAGQARDDVIDMQRRWWATLGDGTWTVERADSTIKRHPSGRPMHLSGDLEEAATSSALVTPGRSTSTSNQGLVFSIQQKGRVFYAAFLDNDAVADPTKADAQLVAQHFADFLMDRA